MALSSSSTQADAEAQFLNSLRWHGDLALARDRLEALEYLIILRRQSDAQGETSYSYESLITMRDEVQAYVSRRATDRSRFTRGIAR